MCFAREFPMKLNAKGLIWRGDTLIFNAVALLAKLCLEYGVNTTAGSYTRSLVRLHPNFKGCVNNISLSCIKS